MNNVKTLWLSLGALLAFTTNLLYPANIIFDLGDVLVETKYIRTIFSIGIEKFAFHASTWNNPFGAHKKLFQFLDSIEPRTPGSLIVRDAHGHILPELMVEWLKGTLPDEDLLRIIRQSNGNFINWTEEALVRALAELIFNPENFVKTRQLIDEGVRFVKECKEAGHRIYILSNWAPRSFELLEQEYPDFFNLFDGKVISGEIGLVKPDPAIFEYILNKKYNKKYDLDPSDTIFIDDQPENVDAAQALGIYSLRYTKKKGLLTSYHDFDCIREKINAWLESKNLASTAQ